MFDDLDSVENGTKDSSGDQQASHWWIGPWAHIIALVVFCLIYFPLDEHSWSWQLAVTATYIVFMFCCTCGIAFKDSDDFFGNLSVSEYMSKLFLNQGFVLALVSLAAYVWHSSISRLPDWLTHRGSRMSLWDYLGVVLFYVIAVNQAKWMANKLKSRFPDSSNDAQP